jgi:intein-encoded DNA endonuclease-like protein
LHIDAENRRQTLEEELEFLKSVHEQVQISCQNMTQNSGVRASGVRGRNEVWRKDIENLENVHTENYLIFSPEVGLFIP